MKLDKEHWLNQRSSEFSIVLNESDVPLFKNCKNIYQRIMCCESLSPVFIAVQYHDKDYDEENKRMKTPHYHLALQLGTNCRVGTLLNKLVAIFHCNENQVGIEKCNSICMYTRYLCHLDDFDKHQYLQCDIVTNNEEVVKRFYDLVIIRDLHDLIGVVRHFHYDLEEIMCNVASYDKWRKYINDLIINYNRRRF